MTMPTYTALVTLLAVALYFFLATRVARARVKFGIKHPATTGNPDFERIFSVHMNTLEWIPTFLVPLWLFALTVSDAAAAALGLVWIAGRVVYFVGYREAAEKRLPGFFIQGIVCMVLFVGAAVGMALTAIQLSVNRATPEVAALTVAIAFCLCLFGGWFGCQLFPPVVHAAHARKLASSLA